MPPGPQINMNAMKVMAVLYSDTTGQQYGLSVSRATGIGNGTLYPILHAMHGAGYLSSESEPVAGKIRRYYRITPSGSVVLEQLRQKVRELTGEVLDDASSAPSRKARRGGRAAYQASRQGAGWFPVAVNHRSCNDRVRVVISRISKLPTWI